MTKSEIRKSVLQIRSELPLSDKMVWDQLLFQGLINQRAYSQCNIILLYRSFQSEIDTWEMIEQGWKDGKKVYVPRVAGKVMNFYLIEPNTEFQAGRYGILEPPAEYPLIANTQDKVLMVLPGLAFDCLGNRIGYGAGYYDEYLRKQSIPNLMKIALAYDFQVFEKLGVEEAHDEKVQIIITPSRTIDVSHDIGIEFKHPW